MGLSPTSITHYPLAIIHRIYPLSSRPTSQAEAKIEAQVVSTDAVLAPHAYSTVAREAVPAAAALNTESTRRITLRIGNLVGCYQTFVPIKTPFPDIPAHVIKAECIRSPFSDRMCCSSRITAIPCNGFYLIRIIPVSFGTACTVQFGKPYIAVLCRICCITSLPAGRIFPLRFGRKSLRCGIVPY